MEKEIFEQPESVINTMRGRVDFDNYKGTRSVFGKYIPFFNCTRCWKSMYISELYVMHSI